MRVLEDTYLNVKRLSSGDGEIVCSVVGLQRKQPGCYNAEHCCKHKYMLIVQGGAKKEKMSG